MEMTPAPEDRPQTNGVNGEHSEESEAGVPVPPPHRTPTSPPPQQEPEPPKVDPEAAEAFKAQGNKFYKAKQYEKAIDEYTKGVSCCS
jgi:DnaJ homolog subfamily C member 7